MSYYSSKVSAAAGQVLTSYINLREEATVPEVKDVLLEKNQAVQIQGCYVYADMVDSSSLGQRLYKPVAAKIMRSYLNGAADILRHHGGEIRGFDGDRVMAIFVGARKESNAVRAALGINWFVHDYLRNQIAAVWPDLETKKLYTLRHCIGIDTGEALITRTGVRGDNDLISIGPAPNVAAKLADLRDEYVIHITKEVYGPMDLNLAFVGNQCFWVAYPRDLSIGGRQRTVYATSAHWEPV